MFNEEEEDDDEGDVVTSPNPRVDRVKSIVRGNLGWSCADANLVMMEILNEWMGITTPTVSTKSQRVTKRVALKYKYIITFIK